MRNHNSSLKNLDLKRKYKQRNDRFTMKPNGLYWSIDNEWLEWCSSEMPHWVEKYNFSLEINEKDIYRISNKEEVSEFEKRYAKDFMIDWYSVSLDYKGIEITNYHSFRFSCKIMSTWIYGWDVNGGCVWDLSAIRSVMKI